MISIMKQCVAPLVGLNVAGIWSAAKLQLLLLTLTLMVTAFWVSPAAAQKYVTDPSTGKVVTEPEYGGTLTYPHKLVGETTDPFRSGGSAAHQIGSVNQHLGTGDWGINREVYDYRDT